MEHETLQISIKDNTAYILLNRLKRLNSFDIKLGEELYNVLKEINTKPEVRAVILKRNRERVLRRWRRQRNV